MLHNELASIYILLKERSGTETPHDAESENNQISQMETFLLVEYTRSAIEILFMNK